MYKRTQKSCRTRIKHGLPPTRYAQAMHIEEPTCQMCGIRAGEVDEFTGIQASLHISQVLDTFSTGGKIQSSWIACSICTQGRKLAGIPERPLRVMAP